jgi:hypothetical protein
MVAILERPIADFGLQPRMLRRGPSKGPFAALVKLGKRRLIHNANFSYLRRKLANLQRLIVTSYQLGFTS